MSDREDVPRCYSCDCIYSVTALHPVLNICDECWEIALSVTWDDDDLEDDAYQFN